jgi:hypothetical protein
MDEMNRRSFLAGLTATAAGLMVPERKVWALDQTMIDSDLRFGRFAAGDRIALDFDGTVRWYEFNHIWQIDGFTGAEYVPMTRESIVILGPALRERP